MHTKDKLRQRAAQLIQDRLSGRVDRGDEIGEALCSLGAVKNMREVSLHVSPSLFDELTSVGRVFDMSIRQMMEMALVEFLANAETVIREREIPPPR